MNLDLSQPDANEQNGRPFRVTFDDDFAAERLARELDETLARAIGKPLVIVCVGTDRSTGDAFGPIVGTKLSAGVQTRGVQVYGTLDEPVHAVNLASTLDNIRQAHSRDPFIIAIDACLGRFDHVGQLILEHAPLRPGAGVKKTLPEFGNCTLTGVVNVSGFMEYFVLQNTRLGIVMRMSDVVVNALRLSLRRFDLQSTMKSWSHQA